ncbi:mechanosensitive ion channel family protein [Chloroflexota bacterium]
MWAWVVSNSSWLLVILSLVLVLLFFATRRFQASIERAMRDKWHKEVHNSLTIISRVIDAMVVTFVVVTLVAFVISEEGVAATVTPQMAQRWFLEYGMRILAILVVGLGLWKALERFVPPLLHRSMARPKRGESKEGMKKREDTLLAVFVGLGKIVVIVIIAFTILSELKVPVGPVLAGFGIIGIAVGFGAQYLIRDLIAGVFILLENQYRVGDVARVADIAGLVEEVNLRKTMLRDLDGIVHHVPNGEIKVASNFTRHFSRVNLDISVAYGTDLDHAISVINRVGQELAADEKWGPLIISAPQVLRVNNLGNSGIDIKILGDVKPIQQWAVMGELRLRLKKAFDAEGIEIPWPHVKLYFGQAQTDGHLMCRTCSQVNLPNSKFCCQCGAALGS